MYNVRTCKEIWVMLSHGFCYQDCDEKVHLGQCMYVTYFTIMETICTYVYMYVLYNTTINLDILV